MRNFFVYRLDIDTHNELHKYVLHDVPRPAPMAMSRLYAQFEQDRWRLESYDMLEALDWLMRNCDDERFCEAISTQLDFLSGKMKAG